MLLTRLLIWIVFAVAASFVLTYFGASSGGVMLAVFLAAGLVSALILDRSRRTPRR